VATPVTYWLISRHEAAETPEPALSPA
jgi:hypothetical protein